MLKRVRLGSALLTLVLTFGCGGQDAAGTSASPSVETPQPSEAPMPSPETPSRATGASDDARNLLRAGANIAHLRLKVAAHLERLDSLHVEETHNAVGVAPDRKLSFDVDGADSAGRCSGEFEEAGLLFRFVTTTDETTLITADEGELGRKLAGRWFLQPRFPLAEYCPAGPFGVTLKTTSYSGPGWLLVDARRVGRERVAGRNAVHFRQRSGSVTVDSWIAADGHETRVIKLVTRFKSGDVTTQVFSEFDSADPAEPEPDPDLVVSLDEANT